MLYYIILCLCTEEGCSVFDQNNITIDSGNSYYCSTVNGCFRLLTKKYEECSPCGLYKPYEVVNSKFSRNSFSVVNDFFIRIFDCNDIMLDSIYRNVIKKFSKNCVRFNNKTMRIFEDFCPHFNEYVEFSQKLEKIEPEIVNDEKIKPIIILLIGIILLIILAFGCLKIFLCRRKKNIEKPEMEISVISV